MYYKFNETKDRRPEMYTVIQLGSSQYKVIEGDVIDAPRLNQKEGQDVVLDKVLMFAKGSDIRIGQPYLKDVKVTAKIIKHFLDRKVIAFKFRRRKNYSKKIGHRQLLTTLTITKISA